MRGYWLRHRLIFTLIMSVALATITGLLFVFPYISQQANAYNSQSIYKNTVIDFIAPEPSEEQVSDLLGTNGIDAIFPYFLTKTQVNVNGNSRTTTVLLSDQTWNMDITMYNAERLIEKASTEYANPILVDWQFCKDTSAKIGDTVIIGIAGNQVEFKIYAIYETNTIYDGGAIFAGISSEQKDTIMQNSKNSGYSGMYITASDYNTCRKYLTTDYRPLGRLKSRDLFEDDAQYQVHYDAIMSAGYGNEITDFRIRESELNKDSSPEMIWIAIVLIGILIIIFNIFMAKRGCEKVYFTKNCIPKGLNVKPYYNLSFVMEILFIIAIYAMVILFRMNATDEYIPSVALDINIIFVPVATVIAEIISFILNNSMIAGITQKVRFAEKKKYSEEADNEG